MIWFIFGILCSCMLIIAGAYWKMNALNKAVNLAHQKLDLACKDRAALIENLISAVQMLDEISPEELEDFRKLKQTPLDWEERIKRENAITRHLKNIFTITRDHPEVELSPAFEKLQNRIIQAEGNYRKNKNKYNAAVHSFYVFGELIPFNVVRWAMEMPKPQYFTLEEIEQPAQAVPQPAEQPQQEEKPQEAQPAPAEPEKQPETQAPADKPEEKPAQTEEKPAPEQPEEKPAQTEEAHALENPEPAQAEENLTDKPEQPEKAPDSKAE